MMMGNITFYDLSGFRSVIINIVSKLLFKKIFISFKDVVNPMNFAEQRHSDSLYI